MLELIMTYTPIVTGVWLITMAFLMDTSNIRSSILFEIFPFFLGLANLFVGLKAMGVL